MCSQWHSLANPGINRACMNISKIGYTRLDTNSLFCQLCMTAVHKAKWLANSKKVGQSLQHQAFLTKILHTGRNCITATLVKPKAILPVLQESKRSYPSASPMGG